MKIIFDTSVATKWFFEEEKNEEAKKLLENIVDNHGEIVEPHIFLFELGNVFLNKKITGSQQVREAVEHLNRAGMRFVEMTFSEIEKIVETAHLFNLSFYDASYVFLAQKLDCEFYTADKKLFNKVKSRKIKIRLL